MPTIEDLTEFLEPLAISELNVASDDWLSASLNENLDSKYRILTACIKEFGRDIPSSELVYLETVNDIIQFYRTPQQQSQYIELRPQSLPINMKIIMDNVKKLS